MDAARELLEVTLSASHPVVLASNKPAIYNSARHHPSFNTLPDDSASPASDVLSSLNCTSGSETSFHAPNIMHRADKREATDGSLSSGSDASSRARRRDPHSTTVENMMKFNKMDTSIDMNTSGGSVRVQIPSRMLKEIACPFTHEPINTPTPPPALRGHYDSQADQSTLHLKVKGAKIGARPRASSIQSASAKEETPSDDSIVTVKSLSEDRSRQSHARKSLSQLVTRNASEGRVIYPIVVEGGEELVQEKADSKGNLQELAAIVASSATAAAVAASQRHISKEILGNQRYAARQTKSEVPSMSTESTQTLMPRQQSAPSKEAALTESTLLSKLSVLQTEVLREVRQDRADISKKLQEIQEYQSRQEDKSSLSNPVEKQVLRESKSVQADVAGGGSDADQHHVASAPRLTQDCQAQTLPCQPSMDPSEMQKLLQLKLVDHGSCLTAEELSSASRLDRRLNEVHQEKKRVDLNLLWMQRDSEHAALLRLLENPALADVHAKLSRLKSQSGDDKENDTMIVKDTKSAAAEKYLKSKGSRLKLSPSKFARSRLSIEHPKHSKRAGAPRPHAVPPQRHMPMFSTPVVYSERGWGATTMASCHTPNPQPSYPPMSTGGSQAQFLRCEPRSGFSPVHVALPLGRPRIMPSSAVHSGPPCKVACTEMPRPQAPPSKLMPTEQLHRLQLQTLSPVDISTDIDPESCTATQKNLGMNCPQGRKVDAREYGEFRNYVEVKSPDQSSSEASLVSVNEYISIPGQQVWVAPTTWTPQKQQAQNSHQGEGGGMQMVKEKISNSMSANLVQRVQHELLARLWAAQQEECTRDPIETGSQVSCSTCGKLGSGQRKGGTQGTALLDRDGVRCLVDQQQQTGDDSLLRQLVTDAILDAVRSQVHVVHPEKTHAEVEASSGEQEYSADFESTTSATTVSMPSAPSTPRDTPPLEEGGAGEEVPEKEEVADDAEAVTPVVTPRPTSEEEEEEEPTVSGPSNARVSPAGTPLLSEKEEEEEVEEVVDAGEEAVTPLGVGVATPAESPCLSVAEEPPPLSPTGSTLTGPSPQGGRVPTEDRRTVALSESVSSVSTKPEASVSASSSSTDHEVSLGEYLLGPLGRARRGGNITLSEGEVPISPGDTEWSAQYARKLGKLMALGTGSRLEWNASLSSSTSDDTTLKEPDQSEGEVRRRTTVKKHFQNIPSHLHISTPTDSSTPGQDASLSSTNSSRLSQQSIPFPTPSFRRAGAGLLPTHNVPPAHTHMQPPVSQDLSVGEVAPHVTSGHHSIGELPSRIRVLVEPPDRQTQDTTAMSPGEIALSGSMVQRKRTINGADVITLGSAHHHWHLHTAQDSSISVGEVVGHQDDTLASLDSTAQLVDAGERKTMKKADSKQQGGEKSLKPDIERGETGKRQLKPEEEIQTEYQTDTFTSTGLTQDSSNSTIKQSTQGPQTEFALSLHMGSMKEGGVVKSSAVTEEAKAKQKEVMDGAEEKVRSVPEEGQVQDGSSSQVPSTYRDDTFQLSSVPSLESASEDEKQSALHMEHVQESIVPSNTDDFILTASGSDTTTLSF